MLIKVQQKVLNKISIIGSGAYACAIYSALKDIKNNDIIMYFYDNECYKFVKENKKHPKMNCFFNENTILTTELKTAIEGSETIFLCCIFSVACDVVDKIAQILEKSKNKNINIIICCKGMLMEKPYFLCDYIERKIPFSSIFVLSGGSFADEMCKKQKTFVNFACKNVEKAEKLTKIFDDFLIIKPTKYIYETEFFGALKNVMAIYCGFVSKNNSLNEIIGNLTDFIQQTKNIFTKLNWCTDAIFLQAGIGDIMLTCLSGKSRNRTFGELISADIKKAKEYKENTTIEGYDSVFAIKNFCNKNGLKFEKLDEIYNNLVFC